MIATLSGASSAAIPCALERGHQGFRGVFDQDCSDTHGTTCRAHNARVYEYRTQYSTNDTTPVTDFSG